MNHIYEVMSTQAASPTTVIFTLRSTDSDRPIAYQPGQYATISFLRHGRPTPARCFSITTTPTEQDYLQFAIRIKGHYTRSAARSIKPGDKITVGGPFGGFIFNAERDKTAIFLAGGIGIAPFMSMIRYATRLGLKNNIVLLYGCPSQDDVPFADELMYLQQVNPHFHVVFAISRGPLARFPEKSAVSGHVTINLIHYIVGGVYNDKSFFVCGPPNFMASMLSSLRANGAREDRIMTEAFSQASETRGSWLTKPASIYALTAIGTLVVSGVVLGHDIYNRPFSAANTEGGAVGDEAKAGPLDVRGKDLDELIAALGEDAEGTIEIIDENDNIVEVDATDIETIKELTDGEPSDSTSPAPSELPTNPSSPSSPSAPSSPSVTKPSLSLSASALSVTAGGSVKLTWSTAGSTPISCSASGGWSGTKPSGGSQTLSPSSTTTYSLKCSNSAGSDTKSVTISVTAAPVAPSVNISASSTTITAGNSTTLSWSSGGTAPITCSASGGWSGTKPASGSQSISPTSTATYTLSCSNSAGNQSKSVTVTVNPAPVKPSLNFSASRTTITEGESLTLSWSTSGTSPISCSASGGWTGTKATSGSQSVSPSSTRSYTLTCTNSAGSVSKTVTVTVNPASSGS